MRKGSGARAKANVVTPGSARSPGGSRRGYDTSGNLVSEAAAPMLQTAAVQHRLPLRSRRSYSMSCVLAHGSQFPGQMKE